MEVVFDIVESNVRATSCAWRLKDPMIKDEHYENVESTGDWIRIS